jgi:2-polyprenyl-6-methoxyphenol hydroxylase-like FAD-dependent oxidoreductase
VRARTGVELDAGGMAEVSAFGVRHAWAREAARGRIVLAGDAAHEISPIGGQGMTLGWLNATELAATLAEMLGGASHAGLRAYQARAARRQRMTARQAFFNTAMGRPRGPAALAARNVFVRAIARPAFERQAAAAFTMAAAARTVAS